MMLVWILDMYSRAEDGSERMHLLQSDVIALESELANLAGELTNYRQCVCAFFWHSRIGPVSAGEL